MNRTRLIQRLERPYADTGTGLAAFALGQNPFTGVRLTPEASKILSRVFEFDYMGAAEFEHGAVPEALKKMLRMTDRVQFTMQIPADGIELNIRRGHPSYKNALPWDPTPRKMHVVCSAADREEVYDRIIGCAQNKLNLLESTGLTQVLDPIDDTPARVVGWLELNNGFFFTVDDDMRDRFWEFLTDTVCTDPT